MPSETFSRSRASRPSPWASPARSGCSDVGRRQRSPRVLARTHRHEPSRRKGYRIPSLTPASEDAAFFEALFEEIRERPLSKEEIHRRKVVLARRFSLPRLPSDAELVSPLSPPPPPSP